MISLNHGPLFARTKYRNTDPETSRLAADEAEDSGSAKGQRTVCHVEVMRNPGQTAAEIAVAVRLERHVPSRRLPELREMGQVYNGEDRVCKVQRRKSMTWWPVGGE